MPDYKITRISQEQPRVWDNPRGGQVFYIKVMLEGHNKPVEIGKKKPDALSVGMVVSGDIEHTEFPSDKFKAAPPQQGSFGGGGFSGGGSRPPYVPKDEAAIKAMWAIGQAVQFLKKDTGKEPTQQAIELWADSFFRMVDRVKEQQKPEPGKVPAPEAMPIDDPEMASLAQSDPMDAVFGSGQYEDLKDDNGQPIPF